MSKSSISSIREQINRLSDLEPSRQEPRLSPVGRPIWVLFGMISLLTISFILWATFTELDKVVVTRGKTTTAGGLLLIEPLTRSIVKEILVREGDTVSKGDPLIVLDRTIVAADVEQLRSRAESLSAEISRLEAEMAGKSFEPGGPPNVEHMSVQKSLYAARQAAYKAKIDEYAEQLSGMEAAAIKSEQAITGLSQRLDVHNEIERMHNDLLQNSKDTSRLLWLQAQDSRLDVEVKLKGERHQLQSIKHQMEATRAEKLEFETQWKSDVVDALVNRQREYEETLQKLRKAEFESQFITLVAVAPSIVLEIADVSVGSVVREGETLMRLVPQNAEIEVEVEAPGGDIAYLETGQTVTLKLDSLPYVKYGTLQGKVQRISADSFQEDNADGQSQLSYAIRISIEQNNLDNVPATFRILPGMPLTAEINVGKRTVMEYILYPLLRGLRETAREP